MTAPAKRQPQLDPEAIRDLAGRVRGNVIAPEDAPYDEARQVWNGTIDRRPALIVQPDGVADVVEAVSFALAQGLGVTVRGGGHHVAGGALSDGGLVIDLTLMRGVRVDPQTRTVRAEAGARLGDLDRETQAHGLVVPAGVVSDTGIAGLTLAGGVGWLRRTFGLTCDNVIAAEVVTADGKVRTVSADEHPDLFWAIRGGGWNMAVVTSFEYRAHPLGPEVMFVLPFYRAAEAKAMLQQVRAFAERAPDEVNILAFLGTIPDEPAYPAAIHGEPFLAVGAVYAGSVEDGRRALQPLRELGEPMMDPSGPTPFVDVQKVLDEDYPSGLRYYWKSVYLRSLDDGAIDTLIERAAAAPSPRTTLDIWPQGGALARVAETDTPVGHRDAAYLIGIESNWEDPAEDGPNVGWARDTAQALEPFSTGGSYLNFEVPDEGLTEAAHGASYQRLVEVKRTYDPQNLFRRQ